MLNRCAVIVGMAAFVAACGGAETSSSGGEVTPSTGGSSANSNGLPEPDVDGAEAQQLVSEGAFLLDVTPPPRNERSELPNRTNIPLPELESRMSEVPRDRPVVVYCLGGRGSPRATQMLREAGYTNVRLLGALENWEATAQTCAGYHLGDACITEENFAQCRELVQQCPDQLRVMESCPLQFACP